MRVCGDLRFYKRSPIFKCGIRSDCSLLVTLIFPCGTRRHENRSILCHKRSPTCREIAVIRSLHFQLRTHFSPFRIPSNYSVLITPASRISMPGDTGARCSKRIHELWSFIYTRTSDLSGFMLSRTPPQSHIRSTKKCLLCPN